MHFKCNVKIASVFNSINRVRPKIADQKFLFFVSMNCHSKDRVKEMIQMAFPSYNEVSKKHSVV